MLAFTYKLYIQVIHRYISHKLYKQVIEVIFTKYVHARLPTCTPLKLKLLLTIFIQERHSKVNGIQAKASCGRIFWGNNVSTKNPVTRIFCGKQKPRVDVFSGETFLPKTS